MAGAFAKGLLFHPAPRVAPDTDVLTEHLPRDHCPTKATSRAATGVRAACRIRDPSHRRVLSRFTQGGERQAARGDRRDNGARRTLRTSDPRIRKCAYALGKRDAPQRRTTHLESLLTPDGHAIRPGSGLVRAHYRRAKSYPRNAGYLDRARLSKDGASDHGSSRITSAGWPCSRRLAAQPLACSSAEARDLKGVIMPWPMRTAQP